MNCDFKEAPKGFRAVVVVIELDGVERNPKGNVVVRHLTDVLDIMNDAKNRKLYGEKWALVACKTAEDAIAQWREFKASKTKLEYGVILIRD